MSNGQNQPPIQRVTMTWMGAVNAGIEFCDARLTAVSKASELFLQEARESQSRTESVIHEDCPLRLAISKDCLEPLQATKRYLDSLRSGTRQTERKVINIGSVVEALYNGNKRWYLIVPEYGGYEVPANSKLPNQLMIISVVSPIGMCIHRTRVGETLVLNNSKSKDSTIEIKKILCKRPKKVAKSIN